MGISSSFSVLTELLDQWENDVVEVTEVVPHGDGIVRHGSVLTDVNLRIPSDPVSATDIDRTVMAEVDAGTLTVERCRTTDLALIPGDCPGPDPTIEINEATEDGDDHTSVWLTVAIPVPGGNQGSPSDRPPVSTPGEAGDRPQESTERSGSRTKPTPDHQSKSTPTGATESASPGNPDATADVDASGTASDGDPGRTPGVPPFEDKRYLRYLYSANETFADMAEEIDMDVTAETVRRYMIYAGIHEPSSYDTGSDTTTPEEEGSGPGAVTDAAERDEVDEPTANGSRSGDVEVVAADGIGLPDGVTIEHFIETVRRSNTIFEVQQQMGGDRDEVREMLEKLNLLDLVMCRLAMESEHTVTREEVVERLRQSVAQ